MLTPALLLALAVCAVLVLARRRLLVVTVIGWSMTPAYQPGDRVLVRRTGRIRVGQVVVAWPRASGGGLVIKRVAAAPGNAVPASVRPVVPGPTVPAGRLVLLGDAEPSVDSRVWGLVPVEDVSGVVVARLHQGSRPPPAAGRGPAAQGVRR